MYSFYLWIYLFFYVVAVISDYLYFIIIVAQMKEAARKQWSIVYSFNLTHDWLILLIIQPTILKLNVTDWMVFVGILRQNKKKQMPSYLFLHTSLTRSKTIDTSYLLFLLCHLMQLNLI